MTLNITSTKDMTIMILMIIGIHYSKITEIVPILFKAISTGTISNVPIFIC